MTQPKFHPATENILPFFEYGHLPLHLQDVSRMFHTMAYAMLKNVGEGPETTVGLRKLLEAKDCFVRQAIVNGTKEDVKDISDDKPLTKRFAYEVEIENLSLDLIIVTAARANPMGLLDILRRFTSLSHLHRTTFMRDLDSGGYSQHVAEHGNDYRYRVSAVKVDTSGEVS